MRAVDWMSEVQETSAPMKEFGIAKPIHKEREAIAKRPWSYKLTWKDGRTQSGSGEYNSTIKRETIKYENTQFRRFGNCTHTCVSFRSGGSGPSTVNLGCGSTDPNRSASGPGTSDIGWLGATDGNRLQPWPGFPGEPQHLSVSLAPLDVDSLLARAILEMKPEIKSELSLLVSLAELKDVRSVIDAPLKIARLVRGHLKKGTFSQVIRGLTKGASDTYLTHVFGTRQIVSDLSGIIQAALTVNDALEDLIKRASSVQVRHWSSPPEFKEANDSSWNRYNEDWGCQRGWSSRADRQFVVTMQYTYELTDALGNPINLQDTDVLLLGAYLDKLGVNWNPEIIWDLIPFSFVVDWFVGIGDWLGSLKRSNLNSAVTILDLCYSNKTVVTSNFSTTKHASSVGQTDVSRNGPVCGISNASLVTKTYTRNRVYPKASWIFGTSTPDFEAIRTNQLLTGASLITSNLLR